MQLTSPRITLSIFIITGLVPIGYALMSSNATLAVRIAYLTLGVAVILGGIYVYALLFERIQLEHKKNRLQLDYAKLQQGQEGQKGQRPNLPRICDFEDAMRLPPLTPEQLYIMQRLFWDDYQIYVKPLPGGFNNAGVLKIIREPMPGNTLGEMGYVVKYLKVIDIRKEIRAHEKGGILDRHPLRFTPGKLLNSWPPYQELGIAHDDKLGAVCYHLATLHQDDQLHTLADIFNQQPFAEIKPYLESLFDNRLLPWYRQTPQEPPKPLGGPDGEYARLSRNRSIIQEHMQHLVPLSSQELNSLERIEFSFLPTNWQESDYYNPIYWILNVLDPGQASYFQADCRPAPIHGDLHMGNILIEKGSHTNIWLIDFPNARVGRALIDFATLEADIKFNHLNEEKCTIEEWLTFEEKLLTPLKQHHRRTAITDPWHQDWQPDNFHLQKAWEAIGFLREQVINYAFIGIDMRAYYLALLHATLPVVYRKHSDCQKQRALVSSAWMCNHLNP